MHIILDFEKRVFVSFHQSLHVCVDGTTWKWCQPFSISETGTIVRKVTSLEQNYTLVIRIMRLSNVQNQVGLYMDFARFCNHYHVQFIPNHNEESEAIRTELNAGYNDKQNVHNQVGHL